MLQTYKAVIRGDRIEWQGDVPISALSKQAIAVHITLLEQPTPEADGRVVGPKVAAWLEQIAPSRGHADNQVPIAWEHIVRDV